MIFNQFNSSPLGIGPESRWTCQPSRVPFWTSQFCLRDSGFESHIMRQFTAWAAKVRRVEVVVVGWKWKEKEKKEIMIVKQIRQTWTFFFYNYSLKEMFFKATVALTALLFFEYYCYWKLNKLVKFFFQSMFENL